MSSFSKGTDVKECYFRSMIAAIMLFHIEMHGIRTKDTASPAGQSTLSYESLAGEATP